MGRFSAQQISMRITLLLLCLLCGVFPTNARGWFQDQPELETMQRDDPARSEAIAGQVQSLLQAMKVSFVELANKRNSWFDRYNALAQETVNQSAVIEELLVISRIAMPIIWTAFMSNGARERAMNLEKGEELIYYPNTLSPVPHPIRILPTHLTKDDEYVVEVNLILKAEANVGIRLMFEPEREADFNWNTDDVLLGVHLRWHFDYGNSREVSLHEKYHGTFLPGETITPEAHWPNLKVGENFAIIIVKGGDCFHVFIVLGEDLHSQILKQPHYSHVFCPKERRRNRMLEEPKNLRVVVNEDKPHHGDLLVNSITWYPTGH